MRCSICGDQSHPTRDCPLKESGPTNEVQLDNEYSSFLSELGGEDGAAPSSESKEEGDKGVTITSQTAASTGKKQTVIVMKEVLGAPPPMVMAPPVVGSMDMQYGMQYGMSAQQWSYPNYMQPPMMGMYAPTPTYPPQYQYPPQATGYPQSQHQPAANIQSEDVDMD